MVRFAQGNCAFSWFIKSLVGTTAPISKPLPPTATPRPTLLESKNKAPESPGTSDAESELSIHVGNEFRGSCLGFVTIEKVTNALIQPGPIVMFRSGEVPAPYPHTVHISPRIGFLKFRGTLQLGILVPRTEYCKFSSRIFKNRRSCF